ncbi:FlhC family transcriptional regulator [Methylomonas sp. Kb3]|uniref:FlhC family transcriptional regulator n=1 Tax=Methylomonas sp. Kb3 TaxID=1611544 RepID=UPI0013FD540E|nr:FlhC family transcriptional regulator [Methylomonas sp. Kb3]
MKIVPFKNGSNFSNNLVLAEKLILLGARPPIVSQLCQLSRQQSIDIFKSLTGCRPKQGMLPHDLQWVIRSTSNNIHASLFLGILDDARRRLSIQYSSAQVLVDVYSIYKNVASKILTEPKKISPAAQQFTLDVNRAWFLISMLVAGNLIFTVCTCCRTRYLSTIHPDATFSQCPICNVWKDRSGRRRWASAKSKKTN